MVVGVLLTSALLMFGPSAPAQVATNAQIRVAHLSPDTPGVDVYVDGERAVSNMGFEVVTDYLSVPSGEHLLELRPTGAPADSEPVIAGSQTLDSGVAYTAAGVGSRAELQAAVFVDDLAAPPAGQAKVRFIHAAVAPPAIDVSFGDGGPTFASVAFSKATDYAAMPPGAHPVTLTDGSGTSLLSEPAVDFAAGITYTIAAVGGGDQPIRILPVVDARAADTEPQSGLATGAGGTADAARRGIGVALPLGVLAGAAAIVVVQLRRRSRVAG
jgi:hypothetical protein